MLQVREKLGVVLLQSVINKLKQIHKLRSVMVVDHSPVPLEEQREKTPEHLHFVFNLDEHNRRQIVHSLHVTNLVVVASIGFEDIEKLIMASLIVS